MCHHITGVLSPGSDVAAVTAAAAANLLNWTPLPDHSLTPLRPGETYYLTSRGGCDCGTGIGRLHEDEPGDEPDYEQLRATRRRKGWSPAKIDRWIEEKHRGIMLARSRNENMLHSPPQDIVNWLAFIHQVLDTKAARYVGFLLHYYDQSFESERIPLQGRIWIDYKQAAAVDFLKASSDTLYLLTRHAVENR